MSGLVTPSLAAISFAWNEWQNFLGLQAVTSGEAGGGDDTISFYHHLQQPCVVWSSKFLYLSLLATVLSSLLNARLTTTKPRLQSAGHK